MKIIFFLLFPLFIFGQTPNIDSILTIPQTLELNISTPQPRLGETFKLTLNVNYVRAHIFKSIIGKIQLAENIGDTEDGLMTLNVNALKSGKTEIGPLNFKINGTEYNTNKIEYEVIESLPNVDRGLWIRKVNTSDSTFCIIIEQRIPSSTKKSIVNENTTNYSSVPETDKIMKFKNSYSIEGLEGGDGSTITNYGTTNSLDGNEKEFLSACAITYFRIKNKTKKIVITKDKFENIPIDFKFTNIEIE